MGMGDDGRVGTGRPFAIPTRCFSHASVMCQAEEYNRSGDGVTTTPESKRGTCMYGQERVIG
jgi:hypothetical protein